MKIHKRKNSSINLCIIGSTNFGKTTIATALFVIATKTDGVIHASGKQDDLAEMKTKLDNRQLEATSWEKIAKFKYELDDGEKTWEISLHDYPGGLFEKYIGQESGKWFSKQSKPDHNKFVFDKNAEKKAKNLIVKLEQADVLMILVPADINDSQYDSARAIYKNKLADFIKKIMSKKPNIPVCLCINKWDMFDCGIEKLEEKLKEEPFCDFYQTLKLVCGENLSTAAISAFGVHDPKDKEKNNAKSHKPLNLLETLRPLAVQAEKARYERMADEWKRSSLFHKILIFPEKTLIWKKAGYTDTNIRTGLNKMAAKAWGLFIAFWLIFFCISFICVTTVLYVYECIGFNKIENLCADYEKNPWKIDNEKLIQMKHDINRPTIIRHVFFRKKMGMLNSCHSKIEKDYNKKIVEDAKSWCNSNANRDIPRWSNPDERKKRAEARKSKLESSQKKLTLPESKNELKKLIDNENSLLADIQQNYNFYKNVFDKLHDPDRKTICRRLRDFIDKERPARPDHEMLFKKLENALDKIEKEIARELETKITEFKNSNPAKNADSKAQQNQKIIEYIKEYETWFAVNSNNFSKFEKMRKELSEDEAVQRTYGPFDSDFAKLDRNDLRAVAAFLKKYSSGDYPERKEKISGLEKLKQQLFQSIQTELDAKLKNDADKPDRPAEVRIADCKTRIEALKDAINNKFVPQSEECGRRQMQLDRENDFLKQLERYNFRENVISALIRSGTARTIEEFLKKNSKDDYKDAYQEQLFKSLEEKQKQLLASIKETLNNSLQQNPEDKRLPAEVNFQRAEEREKAYSLAWSQYIESSTDWKNAQEGVRQESNKKNEWKRYIEFEKDYSEVKRNPDSEILKSIDTFITKYKPKRKLFSKRDNYLGEIEQLCKKKMREIETQRITELGKISEPAFKDFLGWIQYYTLRAKILTKFRNYYPESYRELDPQLSECKEQIGKYKRWNDLHLRAERITKSDQKPEFILPMIYQFFKDFPIDQNSASQIEDDIKRVSEKQDREVRKILAELKDQLKEYKPETVTDESEKQRVYLNRIEIIDRYLLLLRGTVHYNTYKAQRELFMTKLNHSQREQSFTRALAKVHSTLNDPAKSLNDKIGAIDFFISTHSSDFESDHKNVFNELRSHRNRYEIELNWAKIERKVLTRPDDDDALISYRDSCRNQINEAKQFESYSFLKDRVINKINQLQTEIKWVENKIGDGTYASIQKKEKRYKENPTEANYKVLRSEIRSFDPEKPENHRHKDSVETIKKKSEHDWTARQKIKKAWEDLKNQPNSKNLQEFTTNCQDSQLWTGDTTRPSKIYAKPDELDIYKKYLDIISSDMVFVELTGIDNFKNLGRVSGDLRVRFAIKSPNDVQRNEQILLDFKCKHYYWHKGQDVVTEHLDGQFKNRINHFSQQTFIIASLGNFQPSTVLGDHVNIPIDHIEILVKLAAGKSTIQKHYNCPRGVVVHLVFSRE